MANSRLQLKPLRQEQYKQVAEWEYGEQPDGTDWERYRREMNAPQWAHFGLYDGDEFVGCVSLERDRSTAAYHVVTARKKVNPYDLANLLLNTAGELFKQGFTSLVARIPKEKRAAARLALRCGMREWGHDGATRHFILTKSRYLKNGIVEAKTHANALRWADATN